MPNMKNKLGRGPPIKPPAPEQKAAAAVREEILPLLTPFGRPEDLTQVYDLGKVLNLR